MIGRRMDDADHWWDSWNDRPMWLDILILWLSIALLVFLLIAQRIIRDALWLRKVKQASGDPERLEKLMRSRW